MSYHILEVQKIGEDGKDIPPSDFYVVDDFGRKISKRYNTIDEAMGELRRLETEKKRTRDSDLGR